MKTKEMSLIDEGIKIGIKQGIEYGIKQGIEEEKFRRLKQQIKMLINFKIDKNTIIEQLSKDYELSEEDIKKYFND